ncbi:elongation factor G [Coprothermobacter platensis]|uniref:elongation factor G n=1 Tax=Coprothermobacter platensis TaxID=108819 RepID=UPI0003687C3C|nr:elongation factor G [Coprothermobacter platensis]
MGLSEKTISVAVVGSVKSGKTTLVENLLAKAGAIDKPGKVEAKNTVSDFDPFEQEKQISINMTVEPLMWKNVKINLLDTPGFLDFKADSMAAIKFADAVLFVVDGASDIGVTTEMLWDYYVNLQDHKPAIFFINKMDKPEADENRIVEQIRSVLSNRAAPLFVNAGKEVVYIFGDTSSLSPDLQNIEANYRDMVLDAVAEADDTVLEKYLSGEEISQEELSKCYKAAMKERNFFPILMGSSISEVGLEDLLDFIAENVFSLPTVDYPADTVGIVLKTYIDPYVGRISVIKMLKGQLNSGMQLWNPETEQAVTIPKVSFVSGKKIVDANAIESPDIGAVTKVEELSTNSIICTSGIKVEAPHLDIPQPLLPKAIEPKTKSDQEKLLSSLHKIQTEDPSFIVFYDREMKQTIIEVQGEVQLHAIQAKLHERYHVEVTLAPREVPYRETIKGRAQAQGRYVKQTGGHGQYGVVFIEVWPTQRSAGYEFEDAIFGGAIPNNYIPSVDKGIRERMSRGVIAGYPVVDVHVKLFDGKYHPVDSSDMAFQIAGSLAFQEAFVNAKPILLEPIYKMTIRVPEDLVGDIMGDINARRGRVLGITAEGKWQVITAEVPYAEIIEYAKDFMSITGGRGTYNTEFIRYEEVPPNIAEQIIANRKAVLEREREKEE